MNTQSIDERCAELAEEASRRAGFVVNNYLPTWQRFRNRCSLKYAQWERAEIRSLADRIIALRTAEAAQEVQS